MADGDAPVSYTVVRVTTIWSEEPKGIPEFVFICEDARDGRLKEIFVECVDTSALNVALQARRVEASLSCADDLTLIRAEAFELRQTKNEGESQIVLGSTQ